MMSPISVVFKRGLILCLTKVCLSISANIISNKMSMKPRSKYYSRKKTPFKKHRFSYHSESFCQNLIVKSNF